MNDNVSFNNASLGGRQDMIHKKISSIPTELFSEHWQKTREGYCSVIEANLIFEIEAWLEKCVFRFKVEKFERRMNSNFEQQNQILILG